MYDPYASKPWLKFYDPHVPAKLDYPRKTYPELFREAVERDPDAPALHYGGISLTFAELDRMSDRFAGFLQSLNTQPGDVVGVNLPNVPAYYISILGILKVGCVLSGVSPLLTPRELKYQLNDSGAKVLVAMDLLWGNVGPVIAETGVRAVAVAGVADFLPSEGPSAPWELPTIPGLSIYWYADILKDFPASPLPVPLDPDDNCLIQYTGGTTGLPKGATLTHRNMVHHIHQTTTWRSPAKAVMLTAFPLFHQAGLFVAMYAMACGCSQVAVPNPRDLPAVIEGMKKHQPSDIFNVPTLYIELSRQPAFREMDFGKVLHCTSGAAPFPLEYIKEFESLVGRGKVIEVFGMTETSPVLTSQPIYGRKKPGSIGIPLPDTEVKVVDPETKEIVPQGEPGELVAKGPQVFTKGYHNRPEETANTLREGWIYTGDIVRMDEDGYFWVVDRLKDMVNVSGFKVFTRELDEVLSEHPAVAMAASVGIPDASRPGSEIVATAVVLKSGVPKNEETRNDIIAFVRAREAPYKAPKRLVFMDQLPLSPIGKVLKRELRENLKQEVG
jgi:long-chain acyl-CoA synthetase